MRFKMAVKGKPGQAGPEATPIPPQATPKPQASRAARMLALAYYIERKIEAGEIKDYAEAARRLGVSRARVSQVIDLRGLPLHAQEVILAPIT